MASVFALMMLLYPIFFLFAEVKGCHNDHLGDGLIYDEDDLADDGFARRRKRSVSDRTKDTVPVRTYFTACLEARLPNSPFDWRSNVDFSILDSLWFLNTEQTYCGPSGGGETSQCWQEEISNFISGNPIILRHIQTCIAHYAKDLSSNPPKNRYRGRREKRNAASLPSLPVPELSFGLQGLLRYSRCLASHVDYQVARAPLNFMNLSLFIDGNTVDSCNHRSFLSNRQNPAWPFRFITLTRPDSVLRGELESCANQVYPPEPSWSIWGSWSSCSKTCNRGNQRRTRKCRSGSVPNQQRTCSGPSTQSKPCFLMRCRSFNWGGWSSYTQCSKTCGGGVRIRTRPCRLNENKTVSLSGCIALEGSPRGTEQCNTRNCPLTYSWSKWSSYSVCKVQSEGADTCRIGFQERRRTCRLGTRWARPRNCEGKKQRETNPCFVHCTSLRQANISSESFTNGTSFLPT